MPPDSSSASDQATGSWRATGSAGSTDTPDAGAANADGPDTPAIASGAIDLALAGAAGVITVSVSSRGPRAARSAPPMAAVSCGRGVVTTGTRSRPDSMVVTAGRLAPPPTETTATRSEPRIPLRTKASSRTAVKLFSESRIASSSSFLVSRISAREPKSSDNVVTVLSESCSLALRHPARSRLSEPIAEVPAGSNEPVLGMSSITVVNNA